ncbi:UDP-3-O-acyl-N-acetylglucosamine deacetylase [uncultured Campylobacter sp.]|uniref:UDP-3-O-acyl-N-acetylglucosamine deacetylase n=1 Tax=uncultured Campylobacter sp. TaxID=218934 RepID=UPI00260FF850|nr:UDP-3-O-acyl-N-acetylglucosamine deacetylase [uncultured Campylobacter sp.]
MKQRTIGKRVEGVGIGLHKGEPIKLILEPLEADSGVVFYRSDMATSFKAEPSSVLNTQMATVIGNEKATVSTIEHLMSAINSYGIDNIRVILDANEVPVMDGSAISFCMMLDEAGIVELEADKKVIVVKREVEVREGDKYVKLTPSTNPKFNYTIKFENPVIGLQSYTFEFSKENFINQIARARTFGFLKDVQKLNSMGLALGGSLDNAVVIDGGKILNPEGLRFENEFVRHKILDAIGDISLLGAPMIGDYEAFAGSHDLNHKLTLALLSDEKNYEIVTLSEATQKEYEKAFA